MISFLLVRQVFCRTGAALRHIISAGVSASGDRIQTRCRDDGARAQVSRQSNRSKLRDWSARRAILIGTLRWAYHVVLHRNNSYPDLSLT
jgi:hypothetical protein